MYKICSAFFCVSQLFISFCEKNASIGRGRETESENAEGIFFYILCIDHQLNDAMKNDFNANVFYYSLLFHTHTAYCFCLRLRHAQMVVRQVCKIYSAILLKTKKRGNRDGAFAHINKHT